MKIHMRLMAAIATLGILAGCGERPPIETKQIGYRGTGMEQNINPRRQEMLKAMNQIGGIQPRLMQAGHSPKISIRTCRCSPISRSASSRA